PREDRVGTGIVGVEAGGGEELVGVAVGRRGEVAAGHDHGRAERPVRGHGPNQQVVLGARRELRLHARRGALGERALHTRGQQRGGREAGIGGRALHGGGGRAPRARGGHHAVVEPRGRAGRRVGAHHVER